MDTLNLVTCPYKNKLYIAVIYDDPRKDNSILINLDDQVYYTHDDTTLRITQGAERLLIKHVTKKVQFDIVEQIGDLLDILS